MEWPALYQPPPGTPKLLPYPTSNLQFWTPHSSQLSAHRLNLLDKWHQNSLINPLGKKYMKIQQVRSSKNVKKPQPLAYTLLIITITITKKLNNRNTEGNQGGK